MTKVNTHDAALRDSAVSRSRADLLRRAEAQGVKPFIRLKISRATPN
jgi:hypothetical protein